MPYHALEKSGGCISGLRKMWMIGFRISFLNRVEILHWKCLRSEGEGVLVRRDSSEFTVNNNLTRRVII